MMRVIPVLLLALSLVACGRQGRAIKLDGNAYYFPARHINDIVEPDRTPSGQYSIRLIPPGNYYWLVYDPWLHHRPNKQGLGVPTIAFINDIPREIDVTQGEVGPLVCAKKPINDQSAYLREIFTCGFRIYDNGVPWSVIIPGDLAASAPVLKRRAELTLAGYRRDQRALEAK